MQSLWLLLLTVVVATSRFNATEVHHDQHQTFWITPSTQQGCGNRTPCNTIEGYYNQNKSIFSTSNATWIFLQGVYNASGQRIKLSVISAQNVIFKCELPDSCNISTYGDIAIVNSTQVALLQLNLATDVSIRNTSNVTISKVNTSKYIVRSINPTGYLNVESGYIKLTTDIRYCPFPSRKELCWVNIHLRNVTSKLLSLMVHSSRYSNSTNVYNTIDALFDNITVTSFKWTLQVGTFPSRSCNITVINSVITESSSLSLTVDYNVIKSNKTPHEVAVNIVKCNFLGTVFRYFETAKSKKIKFIPKITLSDLLFDGGAVNASGKLITTTAQKLHNLNPIIFHNCNFTGLSLSKKKEKRYVIQLKNLLFPFLLSNCKIVNNSAPAIDIENSILYLKGQNRIEGNNFNNFGKKTVYGDGSIRIRYSGTSQIFIEKKSQLIIGNNRGYYHGGIVFHPIPYINYKNSTYEEYVQCIRDERKGCNGECFFQLVNEKGQFVNNDQLNHFNGSIILYNNTVKNASAGGHQIFNGHLLNCTLQLVNDKIRTNFSLLYQLIHISYNMSTYSSWQPKDVTSFPYYICLCDESQPMNSSLWDCGQNTTLSHYPGQRIALDFSLVGDLNQFKNGSLEVSTNGKTDVRTIVGSCTTLPIEYPKSNKKISLKTNVILPWGYIVRDLFLTHVVNINIIECPLGFQEINGSRCECNKFLNKLGFKCFIDYILYQQKSKNYWIGMNNNKQLVVTNNCPSFFCNNILEEQGVKLAEINSTSYIQCRNNRMGLMCSECPNGYSSAFGTFQCQKCIGPWFLLKVAVVIFTGLALVGILFLFNLTIVQATINGISIYLDSLYLYNSMLLRETVFRGSYLKLVNVLTFGENSLIICYYDGLDEFVKNIISFIYPSYILLLVVFIIIGAHKFNLRIFKVDFVAKRAVPVLATLMVITYIDFVTVVMKSFSFSTLFTFDPQTNTHNKETVWLYQPSLKYFQGKHIALGVLSAVVTVIYLIPLTVVILFGDLLRRNCIRSLWFSHFLDVFHGAYRWPLGFWLGVRLLVRVLLLIMELIIQYNISNFISIVFLTFCVMFLLEQHIIKPYHKRFYEKECPGENKKAKLIRAVKWIANPVNSNGLFIFNIMMFSTLALNFDFLKNKEEKTGLKALLLLSLSAAFIQTGLIIAYHGWMYFPIPTCVKKKWMKMKECLGKRSDASIVGESVTSVTATEDSSKPFPFSHIHNLTAGVPQEDVNEEDSTYTVSTDKSDCYSDTEFINRGYGEPLLEMASEK